MHNTVSNLSIPKLIIASVALIFTLLASATAHAQTELVVSPKQAQSVQLRTDIKLSEDAIITAAEDARGDAIKSQPKANDRQISAPALVQNTENTNFTVGVLASSSASEEGDLYRDPFDVDNAEISPIYPEGVYVDYMRTDAGVNLTSKF